MDDIGDLLSAAKSIEICLANLPGFRPAKQVRAQQKADRIVSAAAYLLQNRSFSDITVQDIAQRAECAVTAIYARFDDKDALLPAVHLIILERNRQMERENFAHQNYRAKDLDFFSKDFTRSLLQFFSKNKFFFQAALRSGSDYIFQQASSYNVEQAIFYGALVNPLIGRDPGETPASLEFAIRTLNGILRDSIISGDHSGLTEGATLAALFSSMIRSGLVGAPLHEPAPQT